jgi:ribosomal protein S18 acetylase RimI-like enzyme
VRGVKVVPFADEHLDPILRMCEAEGWQTLAADRARAGAALTSATTVVALRAGEPVGFAQVVGDGAVTAYLATLVVAAPQRRGGIGRRLVEEAFERSGALRLDLLAVGDSERFYGQFPHRRLSGFRLYPGRA